MKLTALFLLLTIQCSSQIYYGGEFNTAISKYWNGVKKDSTVMVGFMVNGTLGWRNRNFDKSNRAQWLLVESDLMFTGAFSASLMTGAAFDLKTKFRDNERGFHILSGVVNVFDLYKDIETGKRKVDNTLKATAMTRFWLGNWSFKAGVVFRKKKISETDTNVFYVGVGFIGF